MSSLRVQGSYGENTAGSIAPVRRMGTIVVHALRRQRPDSRQRRGPEHGRLPT